MKVDAMVPVRQFVQLTCAACKNQAHADCEFCVQCWRSLPRPMRLRVMENYSDDQHSTLSWVTQEYRNAKQEALAYLKTRLL